MARLFNVGAGVGEDRGVPTVRKIVPGINGVQEVRHFVKVPPRYSGCICGPSGVSGKIEWDGTCQCGRERLVEHAPGNVYCTLPSGFYTIKKGDHFDLPPDASAKAVMQMCPHLVEEADYLLAKQSQSVSAQEPEVKPQDKPKK